MAEAEQSGRLVVGDEYGMVGLGRPSKVSEALGVEALVFFKFDNYWLPWQRQIAPHPFPRWSQNSVLHVEAFLL